MSRQLSAAISKRSTVRLQPSRGTNTKLIAVWGRRYPARPGRASGGSAVYEVGIVTQFEAAHRLKGDFGPVTRLHGHTYRVEICVRGDGLRHDCTLLDLSRLQAAANQVVGTLQYQDLDALESFKGLNSTGEVVARHVHRFLSRNFRGQGLTTLSVRVWESPSAYALYEAPLEN